MERPAGTEGFAVETLESEDPTEVRRRDGARFEKGIGDRWAKPGKVEGRTTPADTGWRDLH
jgi:hypothetical protein